MNFNAFNHSIRQQFHETPSSSSFLFFFITAKEDIAHFLALAVRPRLDPFGAAHLSSASISFIHLIIFSNLVPHTSHLPRSALYTTLCTPTWCCTPHICLDQLYTPHYVLQPGAAHLTPAWISFIHHIMYFNLVLHTLHLSRSALYTTLCSPTWCCTPHTCLDQLYTPHNVLQPGAAHLTSASISFIHHIMYSNLVLHTSHLSRSALYTT